MSKHDQPHALPSWYDPIIRAHRRRGDWYASDGNATPSAPAVHRNACVDVFYGDRNWDFVFKEIDYKKMSEGEAATLRRHKETVAQLDTGLQTRISALVPDPCPPNFQRHFYQTLIDIISSEDASSRRIISAHEFSDDNCTIESRRGSQSSKSATTSRGGLPQLSYTPSSWDAPILRSRQLATNMTLVDRFENATRVRGDWDIVEPVPSDDNSAVAPAPAPSRKEFVADECLSCLDTKPDTAMVPCGCRVICAECAIKVRRVLQKTCLQCQQEYTSITILIEKEENDVGDNKGGRLACSNIERLPHMEMPVEIEHLGYVPLPKK